MFLPRRSPRSPVSRSHRVSHSRGHISTDSRCTETARGSERAKKYVESRSYRRAVTCGTFCPNSARTYFHAPHALSRARERPVTNGDPWLTRRQSVLSPFLIRFQSGNTLRRASAHRHRAFADLRVFFTRSSAKSRLKRLIIRRSLTCDHVYHDECRGGDASRRGY